MNRPRNTQILPTRKRSETRLQFATQDDIDVCFPKNDAFMAQF